MSLAAWLVIIGGVTAAAVIAFPMLVLLAVGFAMGEQRFERLCQWLFDERAPA